MTVRVARFLGDPTGYGIDDSAVDALYSDGRPCWAWAEVGVSERRRVLIDLQKAYVIEETEEAP